MKQTRLVLLGLLCCAASFAQNRVSFAGRYNALDYAYGITSTTPGLTVAPGQSITAGTGSLTLNVGWTQAGTSGVTFFPLATNAPITIGQGANQETITPSAVGSGCSVYAIELQCTITATFTYAHASGDTIASGTVGLQEAVNYANSGNGTSYGGLVTIDQQWVKSGGTAAIVATVNPLPNVPIEDLRTSPIHYWTAQPTTLAASTTAPAVLTSTTAVFSASPVGTWAASAYYLCVTYVDMLGGESPCSPTYNATPTANYSLAITSPAASTGAVGWRAYAGASYAAAYLLPITSSVCTLTTLEQVEPACAIGSTGVFLAPNLTTTALRPNAQASPTVNVYQTYPQMHTTFGYEPTATTPVPFQTNYGPFVALGSLTSGQVAVLGSVNLPAGYLNEIGRVVRITGKLALTTLNTAALPYITLSLGWAGGDTAGAPVAVCSLVPAAAGSSATANQTFSCTLTTNSTGTSGSIMTNGWELLAPAAGGALTGATVDTGTAAIGSLSLSTQDTLYVIYTSTTNTTAGEQLLALNIETVQ